MDKKLLATSGVFAVFKPAGESSAKTVDRVKTALLKCALSDSAKNDKKQFQRLAKQVKVGHGGTLDPMATGVLVIGLNGGCKRLSAFLSGNKCYRAEGRFGEHFDTLDCTGKLLIRDEEWKAKGVLEAVPGLLSGFIGEAVMQRPPAFSAIHVNGVRAYELARNSTVQVESVDGTESVEVESSNRNSNENPASNSISNYPSNPPSLDSVKKEPFELPARPVAIHDLRFKVLDPEEGTFQLEVECGGGCYIRSLIRDLAEAAGSVAVMTALKRTKQGIFEEEHCIEDFGNLEAVKGAIDRSEKMIN